MKRQGFCGLALALALAACGEPPTATLAPADVPLEAGGHTYGGGFAADGSTTEGDEEACEEGRGGHTYGGGFGVPIPCPEPAPAP